MKTESNHTFTYNVLADREIKNLKIFDLIKKRGTVSRTEISRLTGVNIVSISNYVKEYIDEKLVSESGFDISAGGRKPELVELDKKHNYMIGIDLTGSHIRVVLTDIGIKIIKKLSLERANPGEKNMKETVFGLIDELANVLDISNDGVRAVGIGADSGDHSGIVNELISRFGKNVFTGSGALCAAFGEKSLNTEMIAERALYIHSDTGSGIFIRGNELIAAESETPSEEKRYLSPWNDDLGMAGLAKADVSHGIGTKIVDLVGGKIDNITQATVLEAAKLNDEVALSIEHSVAMNLGLRIAYLINLFNPQIVVIGGGPEKAADVMLTSIKKAVEKLASRSKAGAVKIVSGMLGEDAVSLGAASLASREIFLKA